jgi:hypothetical protein
MNKVPAPSKATMRTYYEILELRGQEDVAAKRLAEIQTKRKDLEGALQVGLEGKAPRKYTRRAAAKPEAAPKPKTRAKQSAISTGKIITFMRAQGAPGTPVKLDTLRAKLWAKKDPAALSRALYGLKQRGRMKHVGHKTYALAATTANA